MNKFVNPVLEWHQCFIAPIDNIYSQKEEFYHKLSNKLCSMIKEQMNVDMTYYPNEYKNLNYSPIGFCRTEIASGLLSEEIVNEIISFSNGSIWECGAGSGYNGFLFEQKGANIYCTDQCNNWFSSKFSRVLQRISRRRIKEISLKQGALIYIWPIDKFHDFDQWIDVGGNRLVIIGDFSPCHITISEYEEKGIPYKLEDIPTTCPIFNLDGWELVKTMEPPHYDQSIKDVVQFWIKT
jgi:hypothetical protein